MKKHRNLFGKIADAEALFSAWERFKQDKRKKADVLEFEENLERNIFDLRNDLRKKTYRHGAYTAFRIYDPKLREIHKATVRDRVLHHAVFNVLNPVFEPTFIAHSFSCRIGKGNHKGVEVLAQMLRSESRNSTRPCFVLKCDVRKFFNSVDHDILLGILAERIRDDDVMWLMREIVGSFGGEPRLFGRTGVPIGNLTSQLFANVYMNKFDQFMKHTLRVRRYVRYTDDFIVVSGDIEYLRRLVPRIEEFLRTEMRLSLHPGKVVIRKYRQGVDFLGYVTAPHFTVLRKKTEKRMYRKLKDRVREHKLGNLDEEKLAASLKSYLGVLSHADAYRVGQDLQNRFWQWLKE